jgi:hypothetical protein
LEDDVIRKIEEWRDRAECQAGVGHHEGIVQPFMTDMIARTDSWHAGNEFSPLLSGSEPGGI